MKNTGMRWMVLALLVVGLTTVGTATASVNIWSDSFEDQSMSEYNTIQIRNGGSNAIEINQDRPPRMRDQR